MGLSGPSINECVYQRTHEVVGAPSQGPLGKIGPLTDMLETKRLKLLGHGLRRPKPHLQHQIILLSLFYFYQKPHPIEESADPEQIRPSKT